MAAKRRTTRRNVTLRAAPFVPNLLAKAHPQAKPRLLGGPGGSWRMMMPSTCDPKCLSSQSPHAIARSLKTSSEASQRRNCTPFRSAMSMLNFENNRAGRNLTRERLQVLSQAKAELRQVFGWLDS